jgi:hypothetical protein
MTRCPFALSLIALIVSLSFLVAAQEKQPNAGLQGSLTEENVYTNPALGMTISLPEKWRMSEITTQTPVDPTCTGPLCGTPEIQVEFHTVPGSEQPYKIFLSGFKLSAQYLNQRRYSLKWFADIMLEGSLGSDLVPLEKETAIHLDGKSAFRLLAAGRGETVPRVLGYVAQANGYVFLLVCAAPKNADPARSAIEAMKLR